MSKNLAIELEKMVELKNSAYSERNKCVALIARMAIELGLKAGRAITAIEGWDEEWHNCVYIDLPSGQVSWHYHSGESAQFAALPEYYGKWDGHTTDEKYDRVNQAFAEVNKAQLFEQSKKYLHDFFIAKIEEAEREAKDAFESFSEDTARGIQHNKRKLHEMEEYITTLHDNAEKNEARIIELSNKNAKLQENHDKLGEFADKLGDLHYGNQILRGKAETEAFALLKENVRLKKLLTDFYKNASLDSSTEHCAGISADVESWFAIQEFVTGQPEYQQDE